MDLLLSLKGCSMTSELDQCLEELNQLGFAGPLTTEAELAVSKNIFEGNMLM